MRQRMDTDNFHRRRNKIMRQIKAIDKMVDEDIPWEKKALNIERPRKPLNSL